ncbi:hypothetical protein ACJIZ3_017315 [Penstemon smallii]|uniref:Superoxide dismutase copper/zinc binding domain-containing protein n=1 Tax=Penstemon smallii TaxID=265156 RepID=A0ABD3SWD9_9LAMI
MAAHTVFTAAAAPTAHHQPLLFTNISSHSLSSLPLHSSFHGVALKANLRQLVSLSTPSAAAPKPLTVVSAAKKAVAVLKGTSTVEGVVTLTQEGEGPTTVNVRITGLTPGKHGFHLVSISKLTYIIPDESMNYTTLLKFSIQIKFLYLGPHFNPNGLTHGAPDEEVRHAGDLGNIVANADGVAEATIVDSQIPLTGPNSVVGRAFVVHELEDDLGKGGHELSLSTGNAGGRLACVERGVLSLQRH